MLQFPKQIFVTGTDTEVGKTVVSAMLTLGLRAAYWKPIQSGPETDTNWLRTHTELPEKHFFPERHHLQTPLSPHAAAEIDGCSIHLDDFHLPEAKDFPHLVVEGCGGLLVPLNQKGDFVLDLVGKWKMPTVVVSRSGLGTINHTLLTLSQLRARNIPVIGVVMNGLKNPGNKAAIEKYGNVKVIGEIEAQDSFSPQTLKKLYQQLRA
ncbi:MAG: dethiobiotin synthetase [Chlamydiales bacterium]|jgi:dethiobiotin synthetase